MVATEVKQQFNLIEGEFTPSEANDVVSALIDEKINFHKVQRLQQWMGDCDSDDSGLNGRIGELEEEKRKAKAFFAEARKAGTKLVISGKLEISFVEE